MKSGQGALSRSPARILSAAGGKRAETASFFAKKNGIAAAMPFRFKQ